MIKLPFETARNLIKLAVVHGLILALLFEIKSYNYNFFHILAESYSIVVALCVVFIVHNSGRYFHNTFLKFLSIGYLFISIIDFFHTLAFRGMNIFAGYDANLPTQLWILSRYLESLTLLGAVRISARQVNQFAVYYGIYAIITAIGLAAIFTGNFPDAFIEGSGLTPFKIISEYVIIAIIVWALFGFRKRREQLSITTLENLYYSYGFAIVSELMFTFYSDPFDVVNLLGHYFKILSVYFVYKAVIQVALKEPQNIIFREIELKKQELEREVIEFENQLLKDLAERKQIEKKLFIEKEQFRTTLLSVGDGVISTDNAGRIMVVNPIAEKLTGWSQEEAIGQPLLEVFAIINERTRESCDNPVAQVVAGGSIIAMPAATLLI